MDLYVEKQCVEAIRGGNLRQFAMLYDANFDDLYKYVARRVAEPSEIDRIVRLTFLDALGQAQATPTDITYIVWLYSLAKPRVWEYIAKSSFPDKQGLISVEDGEGVKDPDDMVEKANRVMGKLSLEEREILRLKFFEEVTDGDVTTVLSAEEKTIGPKIYRVLKRAHFLLFGESDERHGVYFGELSGFFEKLRDSEVVEVSQGLKLNLKNDLSNRVERKDFAIEVENQEVETKEEETPFAVKDDVMEATGSNDPAKIFVEAVREMKEEQEIEKQREREVFEKKEYLYDLIDRWKPAIVMIPALLFFVVLSYVFIGLYDHFNRLERGYPTLCEASVVFDGDFSDSEKRALVGQVSDPVCETFDAVALQYTKGDDGVNLHVDLEGQTLDYEFVKKNPNWRIVRYEKTFNSDEQSGEV